MKIGTDIIQISRIENAIAKLWAAKEAISKALGCGIGKELSFHDIIITKNTKGAPSFKLTDDAQSNHHIQNASLSISHDGGFSIAVVALTTEH